MLARFWYGLGALLRRRQAELRLARPAQLHHVDPGLVVSRQQAERALAASPEDLELEQGLRRGRSGVVLWSAQEAAEALAGARDDAELLRITDELLPPIAPGGVGGVGISSIGKTRPKKLTPWQQALEERPPDNADPPSDEQ